MLVIVIREIKILISVIRDQSFLWSLKKNAMPCDTMTPKCTLRQRLVLILSCKESILSTVLSTEACVISGFIPKMTRFWMKTLEVVKRNWKAQEGGMYKKFRQKYDFFVFRDQSDM